MARSPFSTITHAPSQSTSVGQTRPQLSPRILASRMSRAADVGRHDALDEAGDIDTRWAGDRARRVKTIQAPRSFDRRLPRVHRRRDIRKILLVLVRRQFWRRLAKRHVYTSSPFACPAPRFIPQLRNVERKSGARARESPETRNPVESFSTGRRI